MIAGNRRRLLSVSGALVLALTIAAASSSGAASSAAVRKASASSAKHIKIAYFELVEANTFVHAEFEGMKKVAAADGVTLVPFDGNLNVGQQTSQIQDANSSGGYAGYAVEAVGNGAEYPVKQAIAKGITVVTVNQPLGPNQSSGAVQIPGQVAAVLTPPSADGAHVGQLAVAACGTKPCQIGVIVASTANPSETEKLSEIRQATASHHNIKIVGVGQGAFTTSGGITATQNLMQAHPGINVIASTGDDMALGAQKALGQLGKSKTVKIIGGGGSSTGVQAVRSGAWFGTTTKLPYTEGELAMQALVAAIRGHHKTGQSIDPVQSAYGRKIGGLIDKQSLAKDPSFRGQWQA
jgi:ribose transport system substrate-binding protein